MNKRMSIAVASLVLVGAGIFGGCQNDPASSVEDRTRPSVDLESGGGMNRSGSGSDNGSSSSGMDRAGGGFSGSRGANSGAVGSGPSNGAPVAPVGPGGAPTPGR